ncbi:unnamed protein product [marine sediment metagenome]|uniref:Uncharacterized protein n=1 Tax=marine sediment metagenome TaxID=412755 RepID=X1IZX4_9ZZZZ
MPNSKKEICQIRIMFPVETDEQAIEYKKKITALLAEISDAQIQFSLMPIPNKPEAM